MAAEEWSDTGHIFTPKERLAVRHAVLYQSCKRLCQREELPDI